jgi:two-component system chemotaxis response regulator CheB
VLIGTSTGGPPALDAVLAPLPKDYPWPIIVAQHMPASFTAALAKRLDRLCALKVEEVSKPRPLEPGHVYIGRGEADCLVSKRANTLVALSAPANKEFHWHPSVDRLVASATQHIAPEQLVGVLMTGMGADGAATMAELKKSGGHVIAEAAETAVVWGMPGALVAMDGATEIIPLDGIAKALLSLAS